MRYLACIFVFVLFIPVAAAQPVDVPTPADGADKAARSPGGKLVRIVGVHYDRQATPAGGPLGNVVEIGKPNFTSNALCHVLLKGLPVLDEESGWIVPYIPELLDAFGESPASWPVELPRSCRADGCYYIVLLKAEDCLSAADADGYIGSSMHEFRIAFPGDKDERGRFLWTDGQCIDPQTSKEYECSVPVSDSRTIPGRIVRVFGSWSGRRHDLGFAPAKGGQVLPRPEK